jgi:hypothetical protein
LLFDLAEINKRDDRDYGLPAAPGFLQSAQRICVFQAPMDGLYVDETGILGSQG